MSDRTRTAFGILAGVIAGVLAVMVAVTHFGGGRTTRATATQQGCSLGFAMPTIAAGTASFTVSTICAPSNESRRLDVELIGDDLSYDDTLQWTSQTLADTGAMQTLTRTGWNCDEDPLDGTSEIYLRARIERKTSVGWLKGPWVNSATTRGKCR